MGVKEFRDSMMAHLSPLAAADLRPLRVLLVDDSVQVRHELRQLLELSGMVQIVGEAGDGLEAVRLAAELSPEAIVMDLEMPVLDGFEATRRIKTQMPAQRIVILSVHAGAETEQRARAAGADSFVVKGSDYRTLLNAILGKDGPFLSFEEGEKS
jgi:DNA-binding NarL/FixJ family response regulator